MYWVCFYLRQNTDPSLASYELEARGLLNIAVIEDPGVAEVKIIGSAQEPFWKIESFPFVAAVEEIKDPGINWESQWQNSPFFEEGSCTLDLREFGCDVPDPLIKMLPGPGFGDLSHPTTLLTLELMLPYSRENAVIDIGCGSGVLSLAALKAGALYVYAVDIVQDALEHAAENAAMNGLEDRVEFSRQLPNLKQEHLYPVMVMNMITSEQRSVFPFLFTKEYQKLGFHLIVSGVLVEEKEDYVDELKTYGLELVDTIERQGWCGFHFKTT